MSTISTSSSTPRANTPRTNFSARALALYSYEADVVGLLLSATEPYSLYPPCVAASANREVIGIVTQIDQPRANPAQAEAWLRLAGCETVFHVSAASGDGVWRILEYLRQEGTFCRGTTREPGEPGRRPGSFSAIQHIYYGNADNPCGFYQSFQGDPCMILQFPC